MEKNNKIVLFGLILGISIIIAAGVLAKSLFDNRSQEVISVSGSATTEVDADEARWTGNFTRTVLQSALKEGHALMKEDERAVSEFLNSKGFEVTAYEISPVFISEVYKNDPNAPKEYNLTQSVAVRSQNVGQLKAVAKDSGRLADQGLVFSANPVEYYYSDLASLRISLLPDAIKDAKSRAEAIASASGQSVGAVKGVSMGVVQVMPVGAIQVEDYGSYDTTQIAKKVMVTVKATFGLK